MKDKLMSIFVAFVRKTFTKERLLDLIDDLLDVVYDRFVSSGVPIDERMVDQYGAFFNASSSVKEGCNDDV